MTKKDSNYIAAVEKAIAEKYGKDTVQDFRSGWSETKEKEYLKQIKKRSHNGGNKRENKEDSDRTCPVCKTYSFSAKDDLYMNRFKCCYLCYVDFVVRNEKEWDDGWRPSEERLENILRGRKNGNSFRNN